MVGNVVDAGAEASGADGGTVGAAGTGSEIPSTDAAGRARAASNLGRTGRARPSIADTRVAKSLMWKFIIAIWF